MTKAPVRRGRKPAAPVRARATQELKMVDAVEAAKPDEATPEPVPAGQRRRRASTGGHSLKLAAPQREGFTRRWVNDDGNRIADAHDLAYDYVNEAGITSTDTGTRISRLVGTKANGEPLRAYLMETPNEQLAAGVAEKEAHNRQIDDAIAAGRDSTGQHQSDGYVGQGSIQRDR